MKKIFIARTTSPNLFIIKKGIENSPEFKDVEIYHHNIDGKNRKLENEFLESFDVIITDNNISNYTIETFKKREGQILIQTSNGVWIKKPSKHIKQSTYDTDYILCPTSFSIDKLKKEGYTEEQLLKGYFPKIDYFRDYLDSAEIKEFLKSLNIPVEKDIVLFAPSWVSKEATFGRFDYNLDSIIKNLSENEHLVVAPHGLAFVKHGTRYISKKGFNDRFTIIDVIANNKDRLRISGDLIMPLSKRLITDYSSIIFDYAALYPNNKFEYHITQKDRSQKLRVRFGYAIQYFFWGKGTKLNKKSKTITKDLMMYENAGAEVIVSKLKELKENWR